MTTLVVAVIDVAKDAPLVVDLGRVWVAADGLLHEVEHRRGLLLNDVDGAARGARIGTRRAALKRQNPSTLAKGGDVVESPSPDGRFSDGTDDSDAV